MPTSGPNYIIVVNGLLLSVPHIFTGWHQAVYSLSPSPPPSFSLTLSLSPSLPLFLSLPLPLSLFLSQVLQFSTNVRSKETRHLTIHNKTTSPWLLRPVIDGEYWSGPETLSIEPNHHKHYELTYHPLTMTSDTQKHQVCDGGDQIDPFPAALS